MVDPGASSSIGLLQIVLTDDCNFGCGYCLQRRGRDRMSPATAGRAIDRFLPRPGSRLEIQFYGGEPLLEFPLLAAAVDRARSAARKAGARVGFGLTTNGILCDDEVLDFLARHRFRLALSYDGEAQDAQRAPGTAARLEALLERLLRRPSIKLETNSVFTPGNAASLSATVLGLVERGVRDVRFAPSYGRPWAPESVRAFAREVARLRKALTGRARAEGRVPVRNFARSLKPRRRFCPAGKDRIAVDPRGGLWGCALLAAWARGPGGPRAARSLRLGRLDGRTGPASPRRPAVAAAYAGLGDGWSESPSGPCALCPDRHRCWVCPALAALAGGGLDAIPGHVCELNRIQARAAARLAADLIVSPAVER